MSTKGEQPVASTASRTQKTNLRNGRKHGVPHQHNRFRLHAGDHQSPLRRARLPAPPEDDTRPMALFRFSPVLSDSCEGEMTLSSLFFHFADPTDRLGGGRRPCAVRKQTSGHSHRNSFSRGANEAVARGPGALRSAVQSFSCQVAGCAAELRAERTIREHSSTVKHLWRDLLDNALFAQYSGPCQCVREVLPPGPWTSSPLPIRASRLRIKSRLLPQDAERPVGSKHA